MNVIIVPNRMTPLKPDFINRSESQPVFQMRFQKNFFDLPVRNQQLEQKFSPFSS